MWDRIIRTNVDMANSVYNPEAIAIQNYREFITLYNKIAEKCFNSCVVDMSRKALTSEEELCVENCSSKMVNVNHRLMSVFMEIGPPVDKQLGLSGVGGSLG